MNEGRRLMFYTSIASILCAILACFVPAYGMFASMIVYALLSLTCAKVADCILLLLRMSN